MGNLELLIVKQAVSGGKMAAVGSSIVAAGIAGTSSSVGAWRSGEDVGAAAFRGTVVGGVSGPAGRLFGSGQVVGRLANAGVEGGAGSGIDSLIQGNSADQIFCDIGMGVVQSVATAGLLDAAAKPLTTRLGVTDPVDPGSVERLSQPLRNKMKRIANEIAAGGNRGISGAVSPADAQAFGERFVGTGYRTMSGNIGLISADGLRQFRFPATKRGINPVTGQSWSNTGIQVNFQSRLEASGEWLNNVHLAVQP